MFYAQNKLALAATLLALATTDVANAMFKVEFDGSDITFNGQSIYKEPTPLADIGFACMGGVAGYMAHKHLLNEKEQSALTKLDTALIGATVGWVMSDMMSHMFYRNDRSVRIRPKRIVAKTAIGTGIIAGTKLLVRYAPYVKKS